jgi:hypothetical protein
VVAMANYRRKKDRPVSGQTSLFDIIEKYYPVDEKEKKPGSLNIKVQLRESLAEGIKQYQGSRYAVAAKMSELTGQEITKSMLDSWTAESKEGHRFPAEYLAAFCFVTGYKKPLELMARMIDCYLLESEEALLTELGKIEKQKRDLAMKEKGIKNFLDKMR